MDIKVKIARQDNYTIKARNLSDIRYIVIHYTGNQGDTAKNNVDYFAREHTGTSANYFVDENEVWQSVPDNHAAWHCGTKNKYYHKTCRNNNSIGIEITMLDRQGKLRQKSIDRAAQLTRELMNHYNIPIENVVRHYDVTQKCCPEPFVRNPKLWNDFKDSLVSNKEPEKEEEEEMKIYTSVKEMPTWAQETFTRLVNAGIIAKDAKGNISVYESSIQPTIYLDRACGGKLEKLKNYIK